MPTHPVDVIVVGAGAAGLEAAWQLSRRGIRVLLLEARDRCGGRMHTLHEPGWGGPIELGAEFIHGGNCVMSELLRAGRLKQSPVAEQHWWIENGRRELMPDAWERIDGVMRRIGPSFRKSFASWLKAHRRDVGQVERKLTESFVQGFQGAPLDQMSAHSLFEATKEEEEQSRLKRGYRALIDTLVERLRSDGAELRLSTVVERIQWRRGEASIFAGANRWSARAVLLTLPLGVLRAKRGATGAVIFRPQLTRKQQVWRSVESGHALRVILRLRADAWRRGVLPPELRRNQGRGFGFLHSAERFFPVWWGLAPRTVLVGWTGGPAAAELAGQSPESVFKAARQTLATLLDCSDAALGKLILDWRTHDWSTDPFTRGAYSYSVAGKEDAPKRMAEPVAGTLFFAGEATADPLELGTVHGALASGQRAAREILATLG